jgi:hypothetical protein
MQGQTFNFYPRVFTSAKVTTKDTDGNPTRVEFYKDKAMTKLVFSWNYTYDSNGQWITFIVDNIKNN